MHLETLIGLKEKYEEHYIIDRFKKAMEGVERAMSLYISFMAEFSEQLEATEETIAILKRAVTNTCIRVSTSKPKVPEPKSFDRARSSKELENFLWDME